MYIIELLVYVYTVLLINVIAYQIINLNRINNIEE